jgi:hypothetical protein
VLPTKCDFIEVANRVANTDWQVWAAAHHRKHTFGPTHTIFTIVCDTLRKHWVLLEFSQADRLIYKYDSMYRDDSSLSVPAHHIASWLGFDVEKEGSPWRYVQAQTPQQLDGNSCGIYAIACLLHRSGGHPAPSRVDVQVWRFALKTLLAEDEGPALSSVLPVFAKLHETALSVVKGRLAEAKS